MISKGLVGKATLRFGDSNSISAVQSYSTLVIDWRSIAQTCYTLNFGCPLYGDSALVAVIVVADVRLMR